MIKLMWRSTGMMFVMGIVLVFVACSSSSDQKDVHNPEGTKTADSVTKKPSGGTSGKDHSKSIARVDENGSPGHDREGQKNSTDPASEKPNSSRDKKRSQEKMKQQRPSSAEIRVSEQEMKEFARVVNDVQPMIRRARKEMISRIQDSELSRRKFDIISRARRQGRDLSDVSEKEEKEYDRLQKEIKKIEKKADQDRKKLIRASELSLERFMEIGRAIQQKKTLKRRYRRARSELKKKK